MHCHIVNIGDLVNGHLIWYREGWNMEFPSENSFFSPKTGKVIVDWILSLLWMEKVWFSRMLSSCSKCTLFVWMVVLEDISFYLQKKNHWKLFISFGLKVHIWAFLHSLKKIICQMFCGEEAENCSFLAQRMQKQRPFHWGRKVINI